VPVIARGALLFVTAFLRSYGHPQREWRRSAFDRSRTRRFSRTPIAETFLMASRRSLRVGLRRLGNITGAEVVKSRPHRATIGDNVDQAHCDCRDRVTWFSVTLSRQHRHGTPPHHARLVTTWSEDHSKGREFSGASPKDPQPRSRHRLLRADDENPSIAGASCGTLRSQAMIEARSPTSFRQVRERDLSQSVTGQRIRAAIFSRATCQR
jgi:hypothetical protein